MRISDLSIRRPVLATVMSLVLVLVGLIAYQRLTVREYPNIDPPVVTVATDYKGASAEIVETQVTQVLEDSLSGIEGIDLITSINRQERSQITILFKLDRDPDSAAADVRDRVGRVRGRLPAEIEEPVTQKVEGFPIAVVSPCEGTGYEIGSMSIIEGARNMEEAKKFYDFALEADVQEMAGSVGAYQVPSNKNATPPPEAPDLESIKLIDYDFKKYGSSDERSRLLSKWDTEVNAQ